MIFEKGQKYVLQLTAKLAYHVHYHSNDVSLFSLLKVTVDTKTIMHVLLPKKEIVKTFDVGPNYNWTRN